MVVLCQSVTKGMAINMKTMRLVTIICWVVTAVALIGLAAWFLTGRVFGIGRDRWSIGSTLESLTGSFEAAGTYNVSMDNVDSIYIDWVAGDVDVTPYDGNDIRITEFARRELEDDEILTYSISGGTLTIKFDNRDFSLGRTLTKKLEVLVPSTLIENFDKFTVDSVSGSVNVKNANAGAFKIDTTSGSVSVDNVNAGTFKIDTVSGSTRLSNISSTAVEVSSTSGSINMSSVNTDYIKMNSISGSAHLTDVNAKTLISSTTSGDHDLLGVFNNVDIDSISGRVTITSAVVPESLKIGTTSGNITVTVPDGGAVSVSHSSVSGKLNSDIPIILQGKDPQFRFSTISGEVKILALS